MSLVPCCARQRFGRQIHGAVLASRPLALRSALFKSPNSSKTFNRNVTQRRLTRIEHLGSYARRNMFITARMRTW